MPATAILERQAVNTVLRRSLLKKVEKKFTYADCLKWDEGYRAEIINGEVFEMPAPTLRHQAISVELVFQFISFLKKNPVGKLFSAPVDVRLFPKADLSDRFVLEPDLIVVKDPSKLDGRSCNGAPDLVIEILSPSSASRDRVTKFREYQRAGVQEYWLVSPEEDTVTVYTLKDGEFTAAAYGADDAIAVSVLPGCEIALQAVFKETVN